ncbi:MAG: hypothetical protein HQL15_00640 [Candidatus Omnitrophica bacterium]|nr:hypothetical protein [Candidatus Omnitrophota bacterium]
MMDQQQQKQLKVFGYGMPLILAFLGARHGFKHQWDVLSFILFMVAIILLGITLGNRSLLEVVFKHWMKMVHAIGALVTGILLIGLYYFLFTPVAFILKLMGKDFMKKNWQDKKDSYWMVRSPSSDAYTRQF